jgi:glycosyltransferase involved in cell wall biosynthesis
VGGPFFLSVILWGGACSAQIMSNAAIYLHPEGYTTKGKVLMGRHSAGESFLRGFLRHAQVDRFNFWNVGGRPQEELNELVAYIAPLTKTTRWIDMRNRRGLSDPGVLNMPIPEVGREAWHRRPFGEKTYSICGITHTTATATAMNAVGDLLLSPAASWDALVCTSRAVRASVETELEAVRDYLTWQFGPRRTAEPQLATIPLGVNASDFATSDAQRQAWRERLDIPADAIVALYVGRFNFRGKMNPALMAMSLERAAKATGQTIYWVNSGWADDSMIAAKFHENTAALCPSVRYIEVDGREPDTRFSIWSVADFFISFSENIQETFGLTPVEAMAAGLPCVVTDWDGYRDTVRHGQDGFRIPTFAPRPGMGQDLSYAYSANWITYDSYVAAAGQLTAIDFNAAERAIVALITNPDLRRRMGESAKAQAIAAFDWAAIIPKYQALWADLQARRLAAPDGPEIPRNLQEHPWRLDPFRLFASYPTEFFTRNNIVMLSPGMTWEMASAILANPLANNGRVNFPSLQEAEVMVGTLSARPHMLMAELLEVFPEDRRHFLERGILWLVKFGIVTVLARHDGVSA